MKAIVCVLATAAALSACGGGGGDAGTSSITNPVTPTTTYNVAAAYSNFLTTKSSTWKTTGTLSGQTYGFTLSISNPSTGVFVPTGKTETTNTEVLTFTTPQSAGSVTSINYFDTTNLLVGQSVAADGSCTSIDVNNQTTLPTAAVVGSGGNLYHDNDLASCTSAASKTGADTMDWTLEVDTKDTGVALFCQNQTARDNNGATTGTLNICLQIATDGTLLGNARILVSIPGSFTLQTYTTGY